jgi:hypothetical protein
MLVLLIIFVVAAPLLTTTIDIDLPIARRSIALVERSSVDLVSQANQRQLELGCGTVFGGGAGPDVRSRSQDQSRHRSGTGDLD